MRLTEFLHQINKYTFLIERDVMNAGEIKKWVKEISSRVMEPQVQKWFQSQLYQFLINRYNLRGDVQAIREIPPNAPDWLVQKIEDGNEPIYNITITPNFSENASAVIDYINAWSQDNPGREPRMRWEQAAEQSGIWHHDMQKVAVSAEENEKDLAEVVTIYDFNNGYRWVDVNTEVCLKREGSRMGHCVGGYGQHIAAGTTKIFSLRDSKNIPHATIEATSKEPTVIPSADDKQKDMFQNTAGNLPKLEIEQVKGRGNKVPVAKYIPYVKEFLEWGNFDLGSGGAYDIEKMGLYKKGVEYLPLKDVSSLFKKYKDGYTWVKLDGDVETSDTYSTVSGDPYILVDDKWNIKATAKTNKQQKVRTVSMPYGFTARDQIEIRPYVIDLLNKTGSKDEYGGLRKDWKIFHNDGKHGDIGDVGKKLHDLPNGNKIVSAGNNYFVLNDKNNVVFEYDLGIGDIEVVSSSWNPDNLNMNYNDLVDSITEATGEEIVSAGGKNQTSDINGNPLIPEGEAEFEQDGISWYVGGGVPWTLPRGYLGNDIYIGYDRHKNPLYYIAIGEQKKSNQPLAWQPDKVIEDVGLVLGGTHTVNEHNENDRDKIFKPGMDILNIVLEEEWDTTGYDFKETMYDEFMWVEGEDRTWWMADDSAPAKYSEIEYDEEGDPTNEVTDENATLDDFLTATSLPETGLDNEFFSGLYSDFFSGFGANWDERDMEREATDPDTGEGIVEVYSIDYKAEFTGKDEDYKHPKS